MFQAFSYLQSFKSANPGSALIVNEINGKSIVNRRYGVIRGRHPVRLISVDMPYYTGAVLCRRFINQRRGN
jgi:hypothetical protein